VQCSLKADEKDARIMSEMETIFLVQSPLLPRRFFPDYADAGFPTGGRLFLAGSPSDYPRHGAEGAGAFLIGTIEEPIADIRRISMVGRHKGIAEIQIETLQTQIIALKLFVMLIAARGLQDKIASKPLVEQNFRENYRLLSDIATIEIALARLDAGDNIQADYFRVHANGIPVQFRDIADVEINGVYSGSLLSNVKVKWQEFKDADIGQQAHTLANATLVAGALAGFGLWILPSTSSTAKPQSPIPSVTQSIKIELPLYVQGNDWTLERLAQERESYYDPGKGGTRSLQSTLNRLGYECGSVDGVRGQQTRNCEQAAAEKWGLSGLDASSPEFRIRLAREILLTESRKRATP
jgi:hypothetical protein